MTSETMGGPDLKSVSWQPEWEGSLGENGHMYIYEWMNPFTVYLKLSHCLLIDWASLVAQMIESACNAGDLGSIPG